MRLLALICELWAASPAAAQFTSVRVLMRLAVSTAAFLTGAIAIRTAEAQAPAKYTRRLLDRVINLRPNLREFPYSQCYADFDFQQTPVGRLGVRV